MKEDPEPIYSKTSGRVVVELTRLFDEEEMRTLMFDLGFDYDDFGGRSKVAKIREIVMSAERASWLKELVTLAAEQRPNGDWPQL